MRGEQDLNTLFSKTGNKPLQAKAPQALDYMEDLEGEDYDSLTESKKVELLESLIIIMKGFVSLGHGLEPVNKLIEEFENSGAHPVTMINSEDAKDDE